eukprot:GHUV01048849.1.p1 GENE.GHUV01048849.1~~GHUV01048849.1.p1  ORF type:complete len:108 (-),score=7.34 GHUV01048849.1:331-654(-)
MGLERFYLQYYFPPSSVGECGRVGPAGTEYKFNAVTLYFCVHEVVATVLPLPLERRACIFQREVQRLQAPCIQQSPEYQLSSVGPGVMLQRILPCVLALVLEAPTMR